MDAREVGAGALFMAFGAAVLVYAQQYDLGTATQMGPGYFPSLLGGLLMLLGAIAMRAGLAPARARHDRRVAGHPDRVHPGRRARLRLPGRHARADPRGRRHYPARAATNGCCADRSKSLRSSWPCVALTVGIFHYGIQLPFRLW